MQQQLRLSPITAPTHTQHPCDRYQYHPALTSTTDESISNTIHSDPQFELMIHVIKLRLERDHQDLLYHVTSVEIDNIIKRTRDLEATVVILKEKLKELVEGGSHSTARPPNMDWTEEGANSLPTGMEPVYVANATNNSLSQQFGRQCEEESPRLYCFVV